MAKLRPLSSETLRTKAIVKFVELATKKSIAILAKGIALVPECQNNFTIVKIGISMATDKYIRAPKRASNI